MYTFYEFFSGGGMTRYGLGKTWTCLFANDIDEMKSNTYRANFDDCNELVVCDIRDIDSEELPGIADLAWASFPCQDLSLAGPGGGLNGERSGIFWSFWKLMRAIDMEGCTPRLVVLENVCGALTSNNGKDFAAIGSALADGGYRFGAVVMDAVHFLPQSRPRLFIVGVRQEMVIPCDIFGSDMDAMWHPPPVLSAHDQLSKRAATKWVWWRMPEPSARNTIFADLIEDNPEGVEWHTAEKTKRLLALMSDVNLAKVHAAKKAGKRMIGGLYRRTRPNGNGGKVQRAEVRFDDVAGCLRTPAGGSSRQTILVVDGDHLRSRLLAPREAARLMGLPDEYVLPARYNDAYHLVGDGVVVPVVRHLAKHILEPILCANAPQIVSIRGHLTVAPPTSEGNLARA